MKRSQIPVAFLLALLAGAWWGAARQRPAPAGTSAPVTRHEARFPDARAEETEAPRTAGTTEESARFTPTPWSPPRAEESAPRPAVPPLSPRQIADRKLEALDEIIAAVAAYPALTREQGDRLIRYAGQLATAGTPRVQCWSQDTPPEIVRAYLMVEQKIAAAGAFDVQALRVNNHWARTATNGTGQGSQGLPVTLTWSIVPDGTPITASDTDDTSDPSNLRARLAAIYGGSATGDPAAQPWFAVFQAVFDNLAANSGLRFVYEPNDDGATIDGFSSSSDWGTLGARGDIRISGHAIDGNSGTLAYAYYPDNGDVVIDTDDNYIATISNNSIRLRNIMEHEIGHSLGLAHVCPVNNTKLMEPFINTGFRGSQFDDIYSHQRNYGDPLEVHGSVRNNDTAANATPLALTLDTLSTWQWLSIDDSGDTDLYSFPATRTRQVTVRVIPSDPILPADPVNDTYLEGAQNSDGTCSAGTSFDPTTQQDLVLDLLGTNGTTVVASAPVRAAGVAEEITTFRLPADGTHYLRVRGGSADRAQLYRLEVLLEDAPPAPELAITSTRLDAESNSGENGVPDPGETIRLGITLANNGNLAASGLTATLAAAGATFFTAAESYGTLAPGDTGERLFTFALTGTAGQAVDLQLTVNAAGYSAVLPLSLTLGTSSTSVPLDEDFDGSSGLPAGWSQSTSGSGSPWVVSTASPGSAPNSMFSPSVTPNGEALLVSPAVTAGQSGGILEFSHRHLLESARDGGVLEASRNGGAWFDLMNSAATVQAGDYNGTISSNSSSAIKGRQAWTGSIGSFTTTRVKMPDAWTGESIAFRWRLVHNSGTTVTGWYVDDVSFSSSVATADPFRPRLSLTSSGTSLSETTPLSPVTLTLSTPLPLVQDVAVTLDVAGTAEAADLAGPLSIVLPAGETSITAEVAAAIDSLVEGPESLVLSIPPDEPDFAAAEPAAVTLDIADAAVEPATVGLSGLSWTYDSTAKSATVTTEPAGLAVAVTYDGSATLPVNAGSYEVVATVTTPGYAGSATGTLVIVSAYVAWIDTFADPEDPDAAASADLDGDGWDNAGEYTFGTAPDDPASFPRLQPVLAPATLQLLLPPPPLGIARAAETSTDLDTWTGEGVTEIVGGYEVPRDAERRFLRIVYEVVN